MEMDFAKTCCFTGHRPDKCVGTEESPTVRLVCAVPFPGVEKNRTEEQQKSFRAILEKADIVEYICPKCFRRSFPARDKWMADHASGVIAVFNGMSPAG